jgi:hypothetical protein
MNSLHGLFTAQPSTVIMPKPLPFILDTLAAEYKSRIIRLLIVSNGLRCTRIPNFTKLVNLAQPSAQHQIGCSRIADPASKCGKTMA